MKFDKKLIKPMIYLSAIILLFFLSFTFIDNLAQSIQNNQEFLGLQLQGASLIIASFVIGLVDGFNPCAMWVLIYIITLVSQLNDKKRMITIVSIFLLASGTLYFVILFLWYLGWLSIEALLPPFIFQIAGLTAVGIGLYIGYDLWKNGGEAICHVDIKKQRKTKKRIQAIINTNKFTIATVISTIILAFVINSIEFLCSIGLPAVFTGLLTQTDTSISMSLVYMSIYTFAFMLDDIIVFYLALKAIDPAVLNKYSGYSKAIGGVIIFLIGIVVLFFPNILVITA